MESRSVAYAIIFLEQKQSEIENEQIKPKTFPRLGRYGRKTRRRMVTS